MDTGNGAFIMSGNASVSGNTLTASGNTSNSSYISYGGGVYAVITAATTAYMKGNASISRNTIKSFNPLPQDNARGGGLYMATANSAPNATFIMDENASVSENSMESATTNLLGGGVYLNYSASMVMAGTASVSGNSLTVSSGDFKVFGGGVYGSSNKNVLSMYGNASIAGNRISTTYNNNQAARGGGIYLYQSQFFIYSGIVYGNSATLPERLRNTAKYRTGTGPGPIDGQESAIYPSYPAVSKYYKQGDGLTNIGSDFNKTIQVSSGVLFRY
jgi:hypothetical protein